MKQFKFLRTWLLLLCLALSTGVMWGEEATMAAGTNGSAATVNEKSAIKVGTSKAGGTMTITVPAGATSLEFYAAAWNGVTGLSLNITPSANVSPTSVSLTADTGISGNSPFTLSGTESSYKFTIALSNITAETTFTLTSSAAKRFVVWGATYTTGSETPEPTTYTVTVDNNIANGTVTASPTSAAEGDEVTLTATPASGYEFGEWNVIDASSNAITVTDNKFTMPAANVNVSATFNKIQSGGDDDTDGYTIDFEEEAFTYTNWTFTNITTKKTDTNVSAHGGSYFGTTDGKNTGSIVTKEKIAYPQNIKFYISKTSNNSTASSWKIQVSKDETTWTNIKTQSAVSMNRGDWSEVSASLNDYVNVFVRIYYDGTTAVRCIDDVELIVKTGEEPVVETVATPTFSIQSGTYTGAQNVTISCATEEASIYYTTDGSTPTSSSTLYRETINVSETTTIKAIAIKDGYNNSEVAEATYTINKLEGDGTEDNPYTLSDVAKLNNPGTSAWVIGYIRGGFKSTSELNPTPEAANLSLSETPDGTLFYPAGLKNNTSPRADLNLVDHPENVGHQVKIKGTLTAYFSTTGIKDVTAYSWVGDAPEPIAHYNINISKDIENGSVAVTPEESAAAGDVVTLKATPATGYEFEAWDVKGADNSSITVTNNKFTMPAQDVTVSATFSPITYTIKVKDDIYNGTVSVSASKAHYGEEITITATSDDGYEVDEYLVIAETGYITVTNNAFEMPASDVTVWATFKEKGQGGDTPDTPIGEGVTYTFGSFDQANDVTFEADGFTITFHKNTGSTAPQWNANSKEARVYAKGSVDVTSEKNIIMVVYDYTINANSNNIAPTVDGAAGATSAGTWNADSKTWTGLDKKITLTTSGSAGNLGFKSITVYFEAEPEPVFGTINFVANNEDGYWATFSSTKDVIFPADDVIVYTVAVDDGSLVIIDANDNSLSCVTDKTKDEGWVAGYYVQAEVGVLINSVDENVNYYYIDTDPYTSNDLNKIETDPEYNMLVPCLTATDHYKAEADEYYYFKLAYDNYTEKTGLGFWWGAEGGTGDFKVKAGTALLRVPKGQQGSAKGYTFDSMGEANGIEAVEDINNNDVIYNLQGVRLNSLQKGINIVNGRKVIR